YTTLFRSEPPRHGSARARDAQRIGAGGCAVPVARDAAEEAIRVRLGGHSRPSAVVAGLRAADALQRSLQGLLPGGRGALRRRPPGQLPLHRDGRRRFRQHARAGLAVRAARASGRGRRRLGVPGHRCSGDGTGLSLAATAGPPWHRGRAASPAFPRQRTARQQPARRQHHTLRAADADPGADAAAQRLAVRSRHARRPVRQHQAAAAALRGLFRAAAALAGGRRRGDRNRRHPAAVGCRLRARQQHQLVQLLRGALPRGHHTRLQRAIGRWLRDAPDHRHLAPVELGPDGCAGGLQGHPAGDVRDHPRQCRLGDLARRCARVRAGTRGDLRRARHAGVRPRPQSRARHQSDLVVALLRALAVALGSLPRGSAALALGPAHSPAPLERPGAHLAAGCRAAAAGGCARRDRGAHAGVGLLHRRHGYARGSHAATLPAGQHACPCRGRLRIMSILSARQNGTVVTLQPGLRRAAGTSRTLTLGLLAFLLANAFLLNGLLWSLSPAPYRETVLKQSWDVLRGEGGDDSWGAMQVALDHVAEMPDTPLYSKVFFTDNFRFQYPPSALFGLSAMLAVNPARVQVNDVYEGPWPAINTIVGWVFIALTGASVACLLEICLAALRPDIDWRQLRAARVAIVIGLTLTFYPVVKAFTLGQIQLWINGLFALGLLAWAAGWKASSGVLIGAISLIKPHYGLFLLWAALRREMRFAAACAATIGI